MSDDRRDQSTRDRLTDIQNGYERWARITFRALVVIAATLVATAGVLGFLIRANARRGDEIRQQAAMTAGALCSLRSDLEQRVRSTEDFLRDHPRGIPGIPVATLKTSLDGQRRTVNALGSLDCTP